MTPATVATEKLGLTERVGSLTGISAPLLEQQPDQRLVELTRLGNESAFEILFRRYRPRLIRFSEQLLGSTGASAEDVVQEVMCAACTAMLADERPLEVRPWLYRMTRNRCLNTLRDETAAKRPPTNGNGDDQLELAASHVGSAAEQAASRADLRQLIEDLRALPETQRTALVMRELDGLSYRQVAEVMGTTVPGVKSLLVRARLGLVDIVEGREIDCEQVRLALARSEQRLGDLTGAERAHVRGCKRCARIRKSLRTTSQGLTALAPIGLAVPLQGAVAAALGGASGTAGAGAGASGAASVSAAGLAGGGLLAGGLATKGLLATIAISLVAVGSFHIPGPTGGAGPEGSDDDAVVVAPPSVANPSSSPPPESSDSAPAQPQPGAVTIASPATAAATAPAVLVDAATVPEEETTSDTPRGRLMPADGGAGPRDRPAPSTEPPDAAPAPSTEPTAPADPEPSPTGDPTPAASDPATNGAEGSGHGDQPGSSDD